MIERRDPPLLALLLCRWFVAAPLRSALEGDLLEELSRGRSWGWYVWQLACLAGRTLARNAGRAIVAFALSAGFFLSALRWLAPATYPVLNWAARLPDATRDVVLVGWLSLVPLSLGFCAGAASLQRRLLVIAVAAATAYATPLTAPPDIAICDLCAAPATFVLPPFTPLLSALVAAAIAGIGALLGNQLRIAHRTQH